MSRSFFGLYRGLVVNNEDPARMMRIKALVPEVGASVWIEFESGDPSRRVWVGTFGDADSIRDR